MIAIVYGSTSALWVEPVARGLREAIVAVGGEVKEWTVEAIARDPFALQADALYVLPFDAPAGRDAGEYLTRLVPRVPIATPFALQDLCWDKIATQEKLLGRGVPMPDTMITTKPSDVFEMVREHDLVILKEPSSCGGAGHMVLWLEGDHLMGDCGSHAYKLRLGGEGVPLLRGEELYYPGPYYLQRLVVSRSRDGIEPGRSLRAYICDRQISFWTERYRPTYERPSDWIVNVGRGARYRFLQEVGDEAKKIVQRTVAVLGLRFGVVDIVQTAHEGPYVLEVDVDGQHMFIDRSFKLIPEYRDTYDFDRAIATALVEPAEEEPEPEPVPRGRRPPRRGRR